MSETPRRRPSGSRRKPAAQAVADAARDAAFRRDRAGAFPARLRAGLCRSCRRDHGDHARSGHAGLRQHHHRAGALRQAAQQGLGGVLRPGLGAFQSGDPGDRQGGVAADGAALESDHDERRAVRPHRDAAREPRHARPDGRAAAAAGAHLHPFPPRRRRPRRGRQEAPMAEINERLAQLGTSFSHHLLGDEQDWFMELGEDDRAGLPDSFVAAAKAAAEERGMAGKAIVTLSRSSVEPFLKSSVPPRPAREGVQGLHRARRQRQRQRQQRHHRRDPRRCARRPPKSWASRPSPPTGWKIPWPRRRKPCAACWSGSGSRPGRGRWPTATPCRR